MRSLATPSPQALEDRARRTVDSLGALAPLIGAHLADLDAVGAFPSEDVALLALSGALDVFARRTADPIPLLNALRILGRANLSLGRIFEGHINGALLVERYGSEHQRAGLSASLAQGALYGVWNTEPSPGAEIRGVGDEAFLNGSKSYATGAGHIDRAIVTGRLRAWLQVIQAGNPTGSRLQTRGIRRVFRR